MSLDRLNLSPWDGLSLLNREAEVRDPESIRSAWADDSALLLQLDFDSQFVLDPFGIPAVGELTDDIAYLGRIDGVPWFAQRVEELDGVTIRDSRLTDLQYQGVSAGLAVLNWIGNTRFCTMCGGQLRRTHGGFAAVCSMCGREHFPRTDPAIIVAVLDPADRIFLAHQTTWAQHRVSILAGFIEAGESAENALYREVAEEAKLQIDAYRFLGSQPWPFSRSLMLAYVARSHSTGRVDQVELEWGNWYSRAEVDAGLAAGKLILPGPGSIAAHVIGAWRNRTLPAPEG